MGTKAMKDLQAGHLFKLNKNSLIYMCVEGAKGGIGSIAYRRAESNTNHLSFVRSYHKKWNKEVELQRFY